MKDSWRTHLCLCVSPLEEGDPQQDALLKHPVVLSVDDEVNHQLWRPDVVQETLDLHYVAAWFVRVQRGRASCRDLISAFNIIVLWRDIAADITDIFHHNKSVWTEIMCIFMWRFECGDSWSLPAAVTRHFLQEAECCHVSCCGFSCSEQSLPCLPGLFGVLSTSGWRWAVSTPKLRLGDKLLISKVSCEENLS